MRQLRGTCRWTDDGGAAQNLCLELATMGDLKLVERPQNYTLGPGAQQAIRCADGATHCPCLSIVLASTPQWVADAEKA